MLSSTALQARSQCCHQYHAMNAAPQRLHRRRVDSSSRRMCVASASAEAADVELQKKEEGVQGNSNRSFAQEEDYHPQPSSREVETFLSSIVNHTDIAEMNLQVGSFELRVKRSTGGLAAAAAAQAPQTVVIKESPPPPPKPTESVKSMDESMDESLVYVPSPKVGIFTRGKYVGGKRVGKGNVANRGDQLKKGQPLGYVEQLGTYVPVEEEHPRGKAKLPRLVLRSWVLLDSLTTKAPQAGEVVNFLLDEGAPVEYQQVVVEMAPFFGGHIIGDSKYA